MSVIARLARLPFRIQVLALGAVALIAAGIAVRNHPAAPAPTPGARTPGGAPPAPPVFATRLPPEALTDGEAQREAPPIAAGYRRDVVRPVPVDNSAARAESADPTPADAGTLPLSGAPASRRRDSKATRPEIFRMPGSPPLSAPPPAVGATPDAAAGGNSPASPPTHAPAAASPRPAGTGGVRPVASEGAAALADAFAPFGRMIRCQLVNTLDSITARTEPIVGLVTEDLTWNGQVIIPADTEVFSYALPQGIVDARGTGRLIDTGEWTLVLPAERGAENGRELILKGRALDRRELTVTERARVRSWGIDDGADGLVGYTLSTLDREEIKLFAAAAISGLAQGAAAIAGRQQPSPGLGGLLGATQLAPTAADAAIGAATQGAEAVAGQLATRIREEIARRGSYVRVPAGKEFYLFVEQTIDPRAAAVGTRWPPAARDAAKPLAGTSRRPSLPPIP